jgi:hypothetical protein
MNDHDQPVGWLGRLIGIDRVLRGQERIMADISGLQAELAEVKASSEAAFAAVMSALDTLKAQNAEQKALIDTLVAGQVTQEQIDDLTTQAAAIDDTVDAITAAATPA